MYNSRPIQQMDIDGNLIKEFPSISKAAKYFGGTRKAIQALHYAVSGRKNVKNNSNKAFGFYWKYKD
jgi:hypothetical protein